MTVKEIKDKFREVEKIHKELTHLEEMKDYYEYKRLSVKSQDFSAERVQTSFRTITLSDKYLDLIIKLEDEEFKLVNAIQEAEDMIKKIPDSVTRNIFRYRYIDELKWEDVIDKVNYSESSVHEKHSQGLIFLSNL